jgi:acyl carrier protein
MMLASSRMDCYPELAKVVAETLGIEVKRVTPDLNAEAVDTWDSLSHLRLITAVEKHFNLRMTMEEVMSLSNVGDLAVVVSRHLGTA